MNNIIKELAEQAMIFSHENGGWRISTHVPNDFKEKFAELIIRECAAVIVRNAPKMTCKEEYTNQYVAQGYDEAAELILQHFWKVG